MGPKRDKQNELSERQCLDSGTQDAGKTGVPRPSDIFHICCEVLRKFKRERERADSCMIWCAYLHIHFFAVFPI